jgi:hypothetical protein
MQNILTALAYGGGFIAGVMLFILVAVFLSYWTLRVWEKYNAWRRPTYTNTGLSLLDELADDFDNAPPGSVIGPFNDTEFEAFKRIMEKRAVTKEDAKLGADLLEAQARSPQYGEAASQSRAPGIGHYLRECVCSDCRNSAANGGIDMTPFYDSNTGTVTEDGIEVYRYTTPIATCSCRYCNKARGELGRADMTAETASQLLRELNKKWGYAL